MQHDYSLCYQVVIRGICAMAFILLSACSTYTYQNERGHENFINSDKPQVRLNRLYRLPKEMTIWERQEQKPFNYLPYSTYCKYGSRTDSCPKVVKLPAGTIIELVGVNEYNHVNEGHWITLIFAVHAHPELDTLLFEWLSEDIDAKFERVRGNSSWTEERLAKIEGSEWIQKHGVNIRKLVAEPSKLIGTENVNQNGIVVRKVNWRGWKDMVEVEDSQHGFSFVLPSGWSISKTPESTETSKTLWAVFLQSEDRSMSLRVGHRPVEQLTLIERMKNYLGQRLGATTREEIEKNSSHIKSLSPRELRQMNVDSGYALHVIMAPSSTQGNDSWQKEYLFAVQKGEELFFFSLLAKNEFYEQKTNVPDKDYATPANPIFTLAASLLFIYAQRD